MEKGAFVKKVPFFVGSIMNQLQQTLMHQLQLLPRGSLIEPKLGPKTDTWGHHAYQAQIWLHWRKQRLLLLLNLKYNPFTKKWYLSWQKPDFSLASLQVLDLAVCQLLYQLLKQPAIALAVPEAAIAALWPQLAALAANAKELPPSAALAANAKEWPQLAALAADAKEWPPNAALAANSKEWSPGAASAAHPAKEFLAALAAFQTHIAAWCSFEKLKLPLELIFHWLIYCDDFIKVDLATSDPKSTYTLAMLLDSNNQLLLNCEQIDKPAKCSRLVKQEKTALSGNLVLLCQQLLRMPERDLLAANVLIV